MYWLLNVTHYCVQGLFRHLPQWLFGPLIPRKQTANQKQQLANHRSSRASAFCHASGSELRVIAEQTAQKKPFVDRQARVRLSTANRQKHQEPAIPKATNQDSSWQQDAKQKLVVTATDRLQQSAAPSQRPRSYTGYQWLVGWLALRQLFVDRGLHNQGAEGREYKKDKIGLGKTLSLPVLCQSDSRVERKKPWGTQRRLALLEGAWDIQKKRQESYLLTYHNISQSKVSWGVLADAYAWMGLGKEEIRTKKAQLLEANRAHYGVDGSDKMSIGKLRLQWSERRMGAESFPLHETSKHEASEQSLGMIAVTQTWTIGGGERSDALALTPCPFSSESYEVVSGWKDVAYQSGAVTITMGEHWVSQQDPRDEPLATTNHYVCDQQQAVEGAVGFASSLWLEGVMGTHLQDASVLALGCHEYRQQTEQEKNDLCQIITLTSEDTGTQIFGNTMTYTTGLVGQCCVEHTTVVWMVASKGVQYAKLGEDSRAQVVVVASFETRQWGRLDTAIGWGFCEKYIFFQAFYAGVSPGHTSTTGGYTQQVLPEIMTRLEVGEQALTYKAIAETAPKHGTRLLGYAKQEKMALGAKPQDKTVGVVGISQSFDQQGAREAKLTAKIKQQVVSRGRFGCQQLRRFQTRPGKIHGLKSQEIAEVEKLRSLTDGAPFGQQGGVFGESMLSRAIQDRCTHPGFYHPVDNAGEREQCQASEEAFNIDNAGWKFLKILSFSKMQTANIDNAGWDFLKIASFSEMQTAAAKIQKAVRKWLGSKAFFYHLPHRYVRSHNTQESICSNWFAPFGEDLMTQIERWQEKAQILSKQVNDTPNQGEGLGIGKENSLPLPANTLARYNDAGGNASFATPVKSGVNRECETPMSSGPALPSIARRSQPADSPQAEVLREAEKRLKKALELLDSLKSNPDEDVHAVIDQITEGQEDILERMARVRQEGEVSRAAASPVASRGTPINKKVHQAQQRNATQAAVKHAKEKGVLPGEESTSTEGKWASGVAKRAKQSGGAKPSSGKKSLPPAYLNSSSSKSIRQTGESGGKNHEAGNSGEINIRLVPGRNKSEDKSASGKKDSAFALRKAYSDSLLARRVKPDSTNIKSQPLAASCQKPTTP